MKMASIITLALFIVWVLLAIADLWFDIVPWSVFVKITLTFGLLIILSMVISLTRREIKSDKPKND